MDFTVKKTEILLRGRVFQVRRELVGYPDGRQVNIEFLTHSGAVTILPVDEEGQVWFVRQYRHPTGGLFLELPAGTIEKGEEPLLCAERELREEIGMAPKKMTDLGGFFMAPGYSTEYMHVFLATGLYPDALEQDKSEYIRVEKYSIERAYEMVRSGELQDGKSIAILGMAASILRPAA